ncbi:septal ring lytic transglycosylase RlpA family protein [Synechococcus sp. W55.2]|uniref:septal ring lytic transglycosylase RlpA family protein n=1 Tax=Synechococcus sp. W55.2 TaxID=2964513 RepID=UPI0039C100D8
MRNWKQLGQGLDPARKMGLVSCLCVTALGLPVGMLGGLTSRAQASTRTGSPNTRAAELSPASKLPPPATPSQPLPAAAAPVRTLPRIPQTSISDHKGLAPAKLGTLNLDPSLNRTRQAIPHRLEEDPILKIGEQRQQTSQPISTLYEYQMDGRQVVTVYVRDLPIVSFVEHPGLEPPLMRASALVAQLNQMAQGSLKDTTITLGWADLELAEQGLGVPLYTIRANSEELLRIDAGVLLIDNQRPVDVAVLAANRLRRLLLDAPPIAAPALPQPAALTAKATMAGPKSKTAPQQEPTPVRVVGPVQEGIASWYDLHPTRHEMTAAHPTLPFGTEVRVTNLKNGRQAVVRINDRGPFIPGRIIDLSLRAAEVLGMVRSGLAPVRVEVVQR